MKFVIQRVSGAKVESGGKMLGEIGRGFLVLMGVSASDTEAAADKMVKKMCGLRIFEDGDGKTNLSLADVGGALLMVPQFTLYADCSKGNRPSFFKAGPPAMAEAMCSYIVKKCREYVPEVATGEFGADMKISLVNEGPFTIVLDDSEL